MSPNRYVVLRWLAALLVLSCALPANAQQLRLNTNYRSIPQQPLASPDRIEVIDFFFYACPYCHELVPHLERWRSQMPADVVFRRMPVVRHDSWVPLAQVYFTLEALGVAERLHNAVYNSYHDDNLALGEESVLTEWVQKQGLDRDKFMAIFRSDEVLRKVDQARAMTRAYDIQATPSVVVDGRYVSSSGMTGGVPQLMPVVDAMIRLVRNEREKSK